MLSENLSENMSMRKFMALEMCVVNKIVLDLGGVRKVAGKKKVKMLSRGMMRYDGNLSMCLGGF
jgi:hypothetical protein